MPSEHDCFHLFFVLRVNVGVNLRLQLSVIADDDGDVADRAITACGCLRLALPRGTQPRPPLIRDARKRVIASGDGNYSIVERK